MSSRRVDRASVFAVLLIVASALSVFTAGGRVAQEKNQKVLQIQQMGFKSSMPPVLKQVTKKNVPEYTSAAHGAGATSSGEAHPRNLMVKTNDYGRYDPSPAFSKPRFKLIPN